MATIYDIAKRAGVSVTTVSKVLNGYPDVSLKTRRKVQQITAEIGYRPSAVARGLATKKSMTIGVFFQDHVNSGLRHPFLTEIVANFKDVIGTAGYDLLFFSNNAPDSTLSGFEERARHRDVDGICLLGVPRTDPGLVSLAKSNIPCISVDLDLMGPHASYLTSDNVAGAVTAVTFLCDNGHRDIAFVGDQFATKPGHDRMEGFQRVVRDRQLAVQPDWIVEGDFTESGGFAAMQHLLTLPARPSAVFFAGDMMAIGGIQCLRDHGIAVGRDLSVIGFDDIFIARHLTPGLTTIRQNTEEMGYRAAQELLDLIRSPNKLPAAITVETELIIRETVVPYRTYDNG